VVKKSNNTPSGLLPIDAEPIDLMLIGKEYTKKEIVDAD
jgi:hypothetical protein